MINSLHSLGASHANITFLGTLTLPSLTSFKMYQFYYFNNPFQYKYIGCLAMFISAHVHICPCMFLPKLISAHTFLPMYISAHLFLPIRFAFTVIVIFPPVLSYNSHTRRYCPDIVIERLSIALI